MTISYAREDSAFVDHIAQSLEAVGFEVWIDQKSIVGGTSWAASIFEALQNCDVLLAVHSEFSLERSYQCKGEWVHALDLHKRVIPILKTSTQRVHPFLSHLQYIDYSEPSRGYEKLIAALHANSLPEKTTPYILRKTGEPSLFPDFFNQDVAAYAPYILRSKHIRYCGATGHMFFDLSHEGSLIDMVKIGGKIDVLLAKPRMENLKRMAYLSPWTHISDFEETVNRQRKVYRDSLEMIKRLNRQPHSPIELRLLEYTPPLPQVQFDPFTEDGTVSIGIYSFGSSKSTSVLRPGTLLKDTSFPDLYKHFCTIFDNMWARAEISGKDIDTLISDLENLQ